MRVSTQPIFPVHLKLRGGTHRNVVRLSTEQTGHRKSPPVRLTRWSHPNPGTALSTTALCPLQAIWNASDLPLLLPQASLTAVLAVISVSACNAENMQGLAGQWAIPSYIAQAMHEQSDNWPELRGVRPTGLSFRLYSGRPFSHDQTA